MAMTLVSTVTLTTETFQFEFINLPQTGKDLLLVGLGRINGTGPTAIELKINGSQANMSYRGLKGTGSSVASGSGSTNDGMSYANVLPGTAATSNTFGSFQIYIPNYTSTTAKAVSFDGVGENNATAAEQGITAMNWAGSAAITSLAILCQTNNMVVGSTASLYLVS